MQINALEVAIQEAVVACGFDYIQNIGSSILYCNPYDVKRHMKKSKKLFLLIVILFIIGLGFASYDIARRTTFPGSKGQLKERIKKQFFEKDTVNRKNP